MDNELRAELLAMADEDQELRWRAIEARAEDAQAEVARADDAEAAWSAVSEVDRRNTARMKEIIAGQGWPGYTMVGEDGARAAWLLVQHADHDRDFQRECLALLVAAVNPAKRGQQTRRTLQIGLRWPRDDRRPMAPSSSRMVTGTCRRPSPIPIMSTNAGRRWACRCSLTTPR